MKRFSDPVEYATLRVYATCFITTCGGVQILALRLISLAEEPGKLEKRPNSIDYIAGKNSAMTGIPLYEDINELHRLTGATLRTVNPLFHGFDMAETNNLVVSELPPHRTSFYTLALNLNTRNLHYTLNQTEFHDPRYFIVCVAPGQVVRWSKEGNWFGYCLFFKSEFLNVSTTVNFLQQYPFFNISETNLLPL